MTPHFHDWQLSRDKCNRTCKKCGKIQAHYQANMLFDFEGWKDL